MRIEFAYDAQHRRYRNKVSVEATPGVWELQETIHFTYEGWNVAIEEITDHITTNTTTRNYAWGLDLSQSLTGAGGVGGLLGQVEDGEVYGTTDDGHGNIIAVVDMATGYVVAQYDYDAFGNRLFAQGERAGENPFQFSSKYYDSETGLNYYGYRFYDSELGRWLNRDPIEERGGVNLYGFVGNDGLNYYDLFGLYMNDIIGLEPEEIAYYESNPGALVSDGFGSGESGIQRLDFFGVYGRHLNDTLKNNDWDYSDWAWAAVFDNKKIVIYTNEQIRNEVAKNAIKGKKTSFMSRGLPLLNYENVVWSGYGRNKFNLDAALSLGGYRAGIESFRVDVDCTRKKDPCYCIYSFTYTITLKNNYNFNKWHNYPIHFTSWLIAGDQVAERSTEIVRYRSEEVTGSIRIDDD